MPSARVICPYCNANLRLSTAGGAPHLAKCRTCGKTFTPTYTGAVDGAALYLDPNASAAPLLSTPLPRPPAPPRPEPIAPLPPAPAAEPPRLYTPPAPVEAFPPTAPLAAAVLAPAALMENSVAEPVVRRLPPPAPPPPVEQPPASPVVVAQPPVVFCSPVALMEPPPPQINRRPAEPPPRRESPPPAAAPLSEPPPPVIDPANRQRNWERLEEQRAGGLRPYEIALALTLVLAVLGGLGLLLYQKVYQPRSPTAVADADEETPPAGDLPEVELGIKPRPPELDGVWELRSDDGRSGRLVLHSDGTLVAASASDESPLRDYEGHWFLAESAGDRYVLEFGQEYHGLDSYKVTVVLTCPDAFTLVQTVKGGIPLREAHRFVRTGPASSAGPKRPAAAQADGSAPGGSR
jgi:hypothetical protein